MSEEVVKETETEASNETSNTIVAPAYMLSLSVENFRCFKQKQILDLSRGDEEPAQWTLILGENGVGKTTLLQLLALMQPIETGLYDMLKSYIPRLLRVDYDRNLFRTGNTTSDGNQTLRADVVKISCSVSSGQSFNSVSKKNVISYEADIYRSGGSGASVYCEEPALIFYGYGASRRMGTTSLSDSLNSDTSASLFSDTVELLNAEEWLLQADYARTRSKAAERHRAEARYERVKTMLIELLPDVENLRIPESSSPSLAAHVQAKTPYGWVPIQSLSLGYRTLLTWMVDLAARLFERYPDSKNPLAEPAVVLVDEIDLHLHPRWQRTLIQFLSDTFPNTQFIATAHSPLVVQAAVDANIVLLRREGDHVVIENDVEAIKGWRIDQVLTSDLFGLQSARPPQMDAALKERTRILAKSRLTKADKERLVQLEKSIGDLPTGETPSDMEAMDIIRRAAQLLK